MPKILHISDLHFGTKPEPSSDKGHQTIKISTHRFSRGHSPDPEVLADVLAKDPALEIHPQVVVVSGDVGWSGKAQDYTSALSFFDLLRGQWPQTRIVVAPGNHDVDRAPPGEGKHQAAFIGMLKKLYNKKFREIYPFFDPAHPDRTRLVSFDYSPEDNTLIVTANSAAHLTSNSTPVFIDPSAIKAIENQISKLKIPDDVLRIFVMHHHLFPFAEPAWSPVVDQSIPTDKPDSTLVANSAKLQAWLAERSFHVVLHGHKHLSHGRADRLWRRDDPAEGRSLLVLGAGSAGVEQHHRSHEEPLSYNILSINRLSDRRWSVRVRTQRVAENSIVPYAAPLYEYTSEVGPAPSAQPTSFFAERMDHCHGAIFNATARRGLIRGFVSVVETPKYFHPDTANINGRTATQDEVTKSFLALHPEYEVSEKWSQLDKIGRGMHSTNPHFRFRHGPRLFGIPSRPHAWEWKVPEDSMPIVHALETLSAKNISRGYVGMFNAEADVLSESEPLPGLVSLQFIPEGGYLDLVATFRKIELSFWWVVNMYEAIEILHWAATRKKFVPRRITFFSALAEWKDDPEVVFDAELDKIAHGSLIHNVTAALNGDIQARRKLAELLREKAENTSDVHLEASGLNKLLALMVGLTSTTNTANSMPIEPIQSALINMQQAIEQRENRQSLVNSIKKLLHTAATILDSLQTPALD
jgi:3',5'-cyclic AMP phosphodiesterase CpdA